MLWQFKTTAFYLNVFQNVMYYWQICIFKNMFLSSQTNKHQMIHCFLTSLFPFALFSTKLNIGQPHITGFVLHRQKANDGDSHADHPRHGHDDSPIIVLNQHCSDDGSQTTCQVHTAAQDGPPCPKLRRFKPLRKGQYKDILITLFMGNQ